jgi:cbb3-type cytochrome oxidase subunit 3
MGLGTKIWIAALTVVLCAVAPALYAQDAKHIVEQAANAELAANRDDQSHWRYLKREAGGNVSVVVETEHGAISRFVQEDGKPPSAATLRANDERNQKFIHDPAMQQKQRRDGLHDEKDAEELLHLLSDAFVWTIESQTPETVTLAFKPDPNFHPPDMEARVMGEMQGTLVVDKAQHRIRTMKGQLSEDVNIGFGILGRLRKGGTFNVERKQIVPGLWQITETHVHIDGRALFFKTIGQQEDEVKSNFTQVPAGTTLEQAMALLNQPVK